jgi:hypothetical protein
VGLTGIGEEAPGLAQRVLQDTAAFSDLVAKRSQHDCSILKIGTMPFHGAHAPLNELLRFARPAAARCLVRECGLTSSFHDRDGCGPSVFRRCRPR